MVAAAGVGGQHTGSGGLHAGPARNYCDTTDSHLLVADCVAAKLRVVGGGADGKSKGCWVIRWHADVVVDPVN